MLYQLYGLGIDTDFPISDVPSSILGNTDIKIRFLHPRKTLPTPSGWFMQWHLPGGELWLSFAKVDGGYLLRFNGMGDFFIHWRGKEIVYMPRSRISSDTIRHLLLNQVVPLVINLRGREALHASAVLTPCGIIAFSGPAGSGKSTIAGSLLKAGFPLMSDDCLALVEKSSKVYGMEAYPGLRLWEDSFKWLFQNGPPHKPVAHYTDKQHVHITTKEQAILAKPQPLKRIYAIADPSEINGEKKIVIEPLAPRESFMALVRCTFRLDITDTNMLKRQFRFLETVVSTVSIRKISFPRKLNFLGFLREAILEDLRNSGN